MKILLITPGLNIDYNDNAYSYSYISEKGNRISAITSKKSKTKGYNTESNYENINGLEIHRIYKSYKEQTSFPLKKWYVVKKIVSEFNPDIILCSQQKNFYLAKKLKRYCSIPLILLVEFSYNKLYPFRLIGKERFIQDKKLGAFIAKAYWKWLCKDSNAIITCNPNDIFNFKELKKFNKNIFYIPWPSFPTYKAPENLNKKNRGIFIGALDPHKNIIEFKETLPRIFKNSKIDQFFIIGEGKSINIVKELIERFPKRIIHIPKIERSEALKFIAESYFAYAPAKYGAWGFISDCWAMKTPIIVTTNHYKFENRKDSLVCDKEKIEEGIEQLTNDPLIYSALQKGGFERFINYHHAYKIGGKYIKLFRFVLKIQKDFH
jgi:glycosyltransferase involved in cell wall biosynthesis